MHADAAPRALPAGKRAKQRPGMPQRRCGRSANPLATRHPPRGPALAIKKCLLRISRNTEMPGRKSAFSAESLGRSFVHAARAPQHAETIRAGQHRLEPFNAVGRVAVGTALAGGPPLRSQRAELPHWAPALGSGVEAHVGEWMLDAGGW